MAGACEACEGRGWVLGPPPEQRARRCDCTSPALADLVERAGVWPRYRDCTREAWDEELGGPWPLADVWTGRPPTVLCYGHRTGTGKTHVATALLLAALETWAPRALWRAAIELREEWLALQAGWEAFGGAAAWTRCLVEAPLLLIDDALADKQTPGWMAAFTGLLMIRIGRSRPTILTTNATLDAMRSRQEIDDWRRVASRLMEGVLINRDGHRDIRELRARQRLAGVA